MGEREREENSDRVLIMLDRQGRSVRRGHRSLQSTIVTLCYWCVFATVRWVLDMEDQVGSCKKD